MTVIIPEIIGALNDGPVRHPQCFREAPVFQRQPKIMLEYSGRIDPERIADDIAVGGYQAVHTALTAMIPEEITKEIGPSGLRGRGDERLFRFLVGSH